MPPYFSRFGGWLCVFRLKNCLRRQTDLCTIMSSIPVYSCGNLGGKRHLGFVIEHLIQNLIEAYLF